MLYVIAVPEVENELIFLMQPTVYEIMQVGDNRGFSMLASKRSKIACNM